MLRPFVRALYWFPSRSISKRRLRDNFEIVVQEETGVEEEVRLRLYKTTWLAGEQWTGLPRGQPDLVKFVLNDSGLMDQVVDVRSAPKAKIGLKMQGTYRDYQVPAIKALTKNTNGVLHMPPRMGKTVIGVGAASKLGLKTLIVAHQRDLIEQFCKETIYNKKLFGGRKGVAGICSELGDFKKYPICLVTYQTFLSPKGQKLLSDIRHMFGVVLIDECHRLPADRYMQIISKFSAKYMWGLTGTPDRKDGRYTITERLIGPVIHSSGKHKVMKPKLYGHMTSLQKPKRKITHWVYLMNYIFRSGARNKQIARMVAKDVKRGHTVLVPIVRKNHADELEKLINTELRRKVCFKFTGDIPKNKRQPARDRMNDDTSIKVVIAMRPMLLGMNVPRWSCIYTIAPISNVPTYTQEVFRICTPMEGKRTPIIRYFFDANIGVSYGCFRTCCKTLLDRENGFVPTRSFEKLLTFAGQTKRQQDYDDISTFRPKHGQDDILQGVKYL